MMHSVLYTNYGHNFFLLCAVCFDHIYLHVQGSINCSINLVYYTRLYCYFNYIRLSNECSATLRYIRGALQVAFQKVNRSVFSGWNAPSNLTKIHHRYCSTWFVGQSNSRSINSTAPRIIQLDYCLVGVILLVCIDSCAYKVTREHVITCLPWRSGKGVLPCYSGQPFLSLPKIQVIRLFLFQKDDTATLHEKDLQSHGGGNTYIIWTWN